MKNGKYINRVLRGKDYEDVSRERERESHHSLSDHRRSFLILLFLFFLSQEKKRKEKKTLI